MSQVNKRGWEEGAVKPRTPLLLTDYDDIGLAIIHYKALNDDFRAIVDLEKEAHYRRVKEILAPNSSYKVYASFFNDPRTVQQRMTRLYKPNIHQYIMEHTSWKVGADKGIGATLEVIFGELFVTLKYGSQTIRVRLAEFEKYQHVL